MSGEAAFISALEAGMTGDALWGALTPFAGLMITLFVFAFGYYVYRRLTKGGSKGKFKS